MSMSVVADEFIREVDELLRRALLEDTELEELIRLIPAPEPAFAIDVSVSYESN